MTPKRMLAATLVALTMAGAFPAAAQSPAFRDASALPRLDGRWQSPAAEDWGRGAFGTRSFTLRDGRWTLRFVLALDKDMKAPVFAFSTRGTYDVLAPSRAVPGAHDAVFREEVKEVTLLTPDKGLAEAFGLAACGLKPNVPTDISATGCALWKPVSVCGEDHDLLALDTQDRLYFGVRPPDNDMCTPARRPTRLLPPVVRVAP